MDAKHNPRETTVSDASAATSITTDRHTYTKKGSADTHPRAYVTHQSFYDNGQVAVKHSRDGSGFA